MFFFLQFGLDWSWLGLGLVLAFGSIWFGLVWFGMGLVLVLIRFGFGWFWGGFGPGLVCFYFEFVVGLFCCSFGFGFGLV